MNRTRRLALGVIITAVVLGSSIAVASQPRDDESGGRAPGRAIGGGLGHTLKR